jgi:hypothetical protein
VKNVQDISFSLLFLNLRLHIYIYIKIKKNDFFMSENKQKIEKKEHELLDEDDEGVHSTNNDFQIDYLEMDANDPLYIAFLSLFDDTKKK